MVFHARSGCSVAINFVTRFKRIDVEDLYSKCSKAFNYKTGRGQGRDVRGVRRQRLSEQLGVKNE